MNNETIVGLSPTTKAMVLIIPPVSGAVLGWFLPVIAGWVLMLPYVPMQTVLELIASLDGLWVSIIAAAIGVIAGLLFSQYAFSESLKIILSDQKARLIFKEEEDVIAKENMSAVYIEDKNLVILGTEGDELYRERHESKKASVQEAFQRHYYPWKDEDPFKDQYQRWVADHPDFPANVNALLSAREEAIKEEEYEEANVLRKDLAKLGVVIQEESGRQYVRMVT